MEIGSPRGAIFSTLIISPGTQPISISLIKRSFLSKDRIFAFAPTLSSDNRFIVTVAAKVVWPSQTSLRFSEMPASQVNFHWLIPVSTLKRRARLKSWLNKIFRTEKTRLFTLDIIFCDDNYLLKINKEYLKKQYYTDTISFSLSKPGEPIVGEIYISYDRIRENARIYKNTYQRELLRVIFHSALHLCGYSDKTASAKKRMSAREDYWLSRYLG
jgi:rRNA maturation RNase YbeY